MYRGRKKHINFFNINFLHPTRTPPFGPPEKGLCTSFPGKGRKKGTHINFFGGIFGVKNGVRNGPFSATKSLVYCFFLPLNVSNNHELQSESCGREPENGKFPKWLGEGAKGLLSPRSKSPPRVFRTIRNPFCTGATPFCTGATPFSPPGLKRPFAPSPNHRS